MKLLLNPAYAIKPDGDQILLLARTGLYTLANSANLSFASVIHPIHAVILAFMNGEEKETIISKIVDYLGIDKSYVERFVSQITNNPTDIGFEYMGQIIGFPRNLVITDIANAAYIHVYNPSDFLIKPTKIFKYRRHHTVSNITLMLNNICSTQCFYCYADKRIPTKCQIPLDRIKEIIDEAKSLNVVSFDLIGGEVFLYSNWIELLEYLIKKEYYPFVSTKKILNQEEIIAFSKFELPLQFSLDSLIPDTLIESLKVDKDYADQVRNMFMTLEKFGIQVAVHTVLHKKNADIQNMQSLFQFLNERSNILYWKPDIGSESIYSLKRYKGTVTPSNDQINTVYNFFSDIANCSRIQILYDGLDLPESLESDGIKSEKNKEAVIADFMNRAYCAGNFSQIFILPDGKVTICEELYWHPHFIIGDITKQTISQIWNSDKALKLYGINQSEISEKSKCRTCSIFKKCRQEKQICYRDIIRKHGLENWDLPDVNCPL